jgi:hypothetical protein
MGNLDQNITLFYPPKYPNYLLSSPSILPKRSKVQLQKQSLQELQVYQENTFNFIC